MEPEVLTERVPRLRFQFDAIQDLRKQIEEASTTITHAHSQAYGMSNGGTFMRVACIPQSVWAAMKQVDQNLFKDKKRFYRWLNRHPEYRVGKQVTR